MKYAFFSDIHGNFDAFEVAVSAMEDIGGIDKTFCLGDVVGYGAEPVECVALVKKLECPVIAGNHDYAAAGLMDLSYFNPVAREAVEWTANKLSKQDREYLKGLPLIWEEEEFIMVHGTLQDPASFGYVLNDLDALLMFRDLKKDVCFTGHSHYPCVFVEGRKLIFSRESHVKMQPGEKAIVNVGSVGQPRDGDRRVCFVVHDTEERSITTHRVDYDVESAARKIMDAGLPEPLADRLLLGM